MNGTEAREPLEQTPVTALRGVGPKLAEQLGALGIRSVADLLFHLPLRYQDRTRITLIRELAGTVVRCMDLAGRLNLPLGDAIIEELKANSSRGYMHGGKAA